jgi:DNA-binding MarR family transcriptional regulator
VSRERAAAVSRSGTDMPPSAADGGFPASESMALLMRIGLFGMRSAFKETLAKHGVSWSAWYYLRVLWEADGISQRELTERVGTMQPNTVSALRQMKKSSLVRIEPHATEWRRTQVRLTTKARRLMNRLPPEVRSVVRAVALDGFTEQEEADLRRLLRKICSNVLPDAEQLRQPRRTL